MVKIKTLILYGTVPVVAVIVAVFLLVNRNGYEGVSFNDEADFTFNGVETPSIFDRKHKLLSLASTTPGTMLLLQEILSQYPTTTGVQLSVDSELQEYVYGALKDVALGEGYAGGAGVLMDVQTGELLVLTSFSADQSSTNKATHGLFVPGSIVKPFIAVAALSEGIIDPGQQILSTGSITVTDENGKQMSFKDWKAHGYVDLRQALGVSSNVYFYALGGGYEDQPGLGIERIMEYLHLFGLGKLTGINVLSEQAGSIPSPAWKEAAFNGDKWRLADTYLAAIGQHGYEVTPLQMTRAVGAIASNGELVTPQIIHDSRTVEQGLRLPLSSEHLQVVREGMEYVVQSGTAAGLYIDDVPVAAKTGTAEVDVSKEHIHSWLIGYFPSDAPRYAFTFMLESGPWGEDTGAVAVAQNIFKWVKVNRPEYLVPY